MSVYKIYCDESRQNNCEYHLIGGVWIQAESGWDFVNDFHSLCRTRLGILPAHMKWTNVPSKPTSKYYGFYTDLIDLYFDYNRQGKMCFRTIIADRDYVIDHDIHHSGDAEVGFYKLYYQLILHTLSVDSFYHLRIAKRPVSKKAQDMGEMERLNDLKNALNNGVRKKYTERGIFFSRDLVLSIQARMAKERVLIQLADIMMGATGYHWNKEHLKERASEGKVSLSKYIASKLGRENLCFITYASNRNFNVFHLKPRK